MAGFWFRKQRVHLGTLVLQFYLSFAVHTSHRFSLFIDFYTDHYIFTITLQFQLYFNLGEKKVIFLDHTEFCSTKCSISILSAWCLACSAKERGLLRSSVIAFALVQTHSFGEWFEGSRCCNTTKIGDPISIRWECHFWGLWVQFRDSYLFCLTYLMGNCCWITTNSKFIARVYNNMGGGILESSLPIVQSSPSSMSSLHKWNLYYFLPFL